jgi:hypothetical protein
VVISKRHGGLESNNHCSSHFSRHWR